MSKFKSYGKGRGNSRAGLQFDALLKACSNSKKPPANCAAGAIGRFGQAQFTSTRANLDSTGEDEQEKPSRFSSFKKRSRIEALLPPQLQVVDPFTSHHYSIGTDRSSPPPSLQPQPVFKPRKFFKSRGPIEVEQNAQIKPLRPDASFSCNSPILGSNQSNISLNSRAGDMFSSPPIKIKIIKDKGKFVCAEESSPTESKSMETLSSPKKERKRRVSTSANKEKTLVIQGQGRGRGRPPKKRARNEEEEEEEEQQEPKKIERAPPNPKRDSARITRSSVKYQDCGQVEHENQNTAPNEYTRSVESFSGIPTKASSEETLRKLEEDPEFQQLSQMLSSMQDEASSESGTPNSNKHHHLQPEISPERREMHAIVGDDWNDSVTEESPTKFKILPSRFDYTPEQKSPPMHFSVTPPSTSPEIQRPSPNFSHQTFNIHSSPYSMKNLLSAQDVKTQLNSSINFDIAKGCTPDSGVLSGSSSSQETLMGINQATSTLESSQEPEAVSIESNSSSQTQPKKASIFKSRAAKKDQSTKAVYKHTFGQVDSSKEDIQPATQPPGSVFEEFDDDVSDLSLRKSVEGQLSSDSDEKGKVFCKKTAKRLFTVVQNVKAGHELQESGEVHEFDGDIWYILEELKDKNPINSRCLCAITLAGRCMDQAFRMHLRAQGTVAEFCKELHDAPQHPVLSLLTATVFFVLSQDRLNMDLDTESLKLILALTKADSRENNEKFAENHESIKNRQRVIQLCSEMQNRGHAKHLYLENITASELALETLLYLTSKRAGEWVKHELRTLGGLDSIVGEVDSSFKFVRAEIRCSNWDEVVKERLRKIDRCLEVLGRVTFNHEDNQRYLMQVSTRETEDGQSSKCCPASPTVFLEMFQFCKEVLAVENTVLTTEQIGMIREILFLVLRLLVNLSHDYRGIVLGSEIIMQSKGFLELTLYSIFEMTDHFPEEKVFDLLMHSLCLLLNVVEISLNNRDRLLQTTIHKSPTGAFTVTAYHPDSDDSGVEDEIPLLDALVEMFLQKERSAKKEEQHTDNILTTGEKDKPSESGNSSSKDSQEEGGNSVQDTIDKLIQTAGAHMENSLIAAYISLLIAFLVMDDKLNAEKVRDTMPCRNFLPLMVVLKKLFNFMSITSSASGSTRGLKATSVALKFYSKIDPASAEELKKVIPE